MSQTTPTSTRRWTRPITAAYTSDGYKQGHVVQYPDGTQMVYSNETPRYSRIPNVDYVFVFGPQYFAKTYLVELWDEFFQTPLEDVLAAFRHRIRNYLGPIDDDHIVALHKLGYLPLEVKALPEGTLCPMRVPVYTVKSTHPEFGWLTNAIETAMSTQTWMMMTNATIAFQYLILLTKYADDTVGNRDFVQWQAHDFSMRGMSSLTSAYMSGLSHLAVGFTGTDTIPAIDYAEMYYNANAATELVGGTVPATEHSVMSAAGREDEIGTFKRLITKVYPAGVVSIVSDTWDLWKVVTEYVSILKPDILARNGKVVIRPDSGDPVRIVCGEAYPVSELDRVAFEEAREAGYDKVLCQGNYYKVIFDEDEDDYVVAKIPNPTPADKGVVQCLWDVFGGTITAKGFRLLDSHIGVIYGDSITLQRCELILRLLKMAGYASYNMVFGVGSFTYQYNTRDTFSTAFKATGATVNSVFRELSKDPVTDNGVKKSAVGFLRVDIVNGWFALKDRVTEAEADGGELKRIFLNGQLSQDITLKQVREEGKKSLEKVLQRNAA